MPNPSRNRQGPTDSNSPRSNPPSAAPGTLPMPPSTAAVNALRPGKNPMKKCTCRYINAYSTPAAPASAAPTAKVIMITRSTLIPISAATSLSSDTARMAFPILVRMTKIYNPIIIRTEATITTIWDFKISSPKMVHDPFRRATSGKAVMPEPYRPRKKYCQKNEAPMAVINGTRRGARRSGR